MDEELDVLVFGAGALGSLVGGLLARRHTVRLVGREPHVSTVREDGLRVTGQLDAHVTLQATTAIGDWDGDVAVVTVKAGDLPAAADALADRTGVVCPLTNGLPEYELRERLGDRVVGGTATYGAQLVEPGVVRCTGTGEIHLGELGDRRGAADAADAEAVSDRVARLVAGFQAAGLDCTGEPRIDRRLWAKLAVNAGINPVTALLGADNGALVDGPSRPVARRAARETARVARAEGIDLAPAEAVQRLTTVARATAANRSSMASDVAAGRPTEIAAINGAVVRRGEQADVAVPTNRTLFELVRGWEAAHAE